MTTEDTENERLRAENDLLRLYLANAEQGRTHFMTRFNLTARHAEEAEKHIGDLITALSLVIAEVEMSLASVPPSTRGTVRLNPDSRFSISNAVILKIRKTLERIDNANRAP